MLETLVALLLATVLFVPLSRRLGFGSVLGYLVAGAIIGPLGLALVSDIDRIAEIAELGVVMLLFLIGLELRPRRLWVMRRAVFGLGAAQVAVSGLALGVLAYLAGVGAAGAAVLGAGLALSSTAIVLPMLAERDLLAAPAVATPLQCCCSRISPSSPWWRWCPCCRRTSCWSRGCWPAHRPSCRGATCCRPPPWSLRSWSAAGS